ncbi:hypothetical protein AB0L40_04260 [Patulibacter sp. NPDC049589]|uniref:hypothetical protein n=1 Tax=Patulibacter sp. NPDC049589 TaxID=3154731 RepID=UPI00342E6B2B
MLDGVVIRAESVLPEVSDVVGAQGEENHEPGARDPVAGDGSEDSGKDGGQRWRQGVRGDVGRHPGFALAGNRRLTTRDAW